MVSRPALVSVGLFIVVQSARAEPTVGLLDCRPSPGRVAARAHLHAPARRPNPSPRQRVFLAGADCCRRGRIKSGARWNLFICICYIVSVAGVSRVGPARNALESLLSRVKQNKLFRPSAQANGSEQVNVIAPKPRRSRCRSALRLRQRSIDTVSTFVFEIGRRNILLRARIALIVTEAARSRKCKWPPVLADACVFSLLCRADLIRHSSMSLRRADLCAAECISVRYCSRS